MEQPFIFRQSTHIPYSHKDNDDYLRHADSYLARGLAEHIAKETAVSTDHDHYIERRLEVVVTTAAKFWEFVHHEAMRYASEVIERDRLMNEANAKDNEGPKRKE